MAPKTIIILATAIAVVLLAQILVVSSSTTEQTVTEGASTDSASTSSSLDVSASTPDGITQSPPNPSSTSDASTPDGITQSPPNPSSSSDASTPNRITQSPPNPSSSSDASTPDRITQSPPNPSDSTKSETELPDSTTITTQKTATTPSSVFPDWAPAVIGVSAILILALSIGITILIFKYVCKKNPDGDSGKHQPYRYEAGELNDAYAEEYLESQYRRPSRPISSDSNTGSQGRFVYISTDL